MQVKGYIHILAENLFRGTFNMLCPGEIKLENSSHFAAKMILAYTNSFCTEAIEVRI